MDIISFVRSIEKYDFTIRDNIGDFNEVGFLTFCLTARVRFHHYGYYFFRAVRLRVYLNYTDFK